MVSSLLKKSFFLAAFGMFAASAHAQVSLFSQNFDGYTTGTNVPAAATGQSFVTVTGVFPVSNTNASTLFPLGNSGSATAGGDANSNYATFGTVAAERARTASVTGFGGVLASVYYDINLLSTGTGGVSLSVVNTSASDVNLGTGTFTAFSLSNAGAVTAAGTGVTLAGGTGTISINSQVVLSLVINSTAAPLAYTSAGFTMTLPAFTSDLYASSAAGVATYVGRLTSTTGTNATTNVPQQLGFANFNGTAPNLRINEVNIVTGGNIATLVPEPSTYACMFVALGGLALHVRNRRASRMA